MSEENKLDKQAFTIASRNIGLQVMLMATCDPKEKVIMSRDIPKTLIDGMVLTGVIPIYLKSELDIMAQLKELIALEGGIRAIFLTKPLMALEDIQMIVDLCHHHGLIVLTENDEMGQIRGDLALISNHEVLLNTDLIHGSVIESAIGLLTDETDIDEVFHSVLKKAPPAGPMILSPRDAFYAKKEVVSLEESVGKIAGESIQLVGENTPLVTLGEGVTDEMVTYIAYLKENKEHFYPTYDSSLSFIKVITAKKYVKRLR